MRWHRLIAQQASMLDGRPAEMYQSSDNAAKHLAQDFTESCLMSLAVWRRFGTAEFAEALGWLHRTDYAAMLAAMPDRVVDAAVQVWSQGRHAVGERTAAQRAARAVEARAWEFGHAAAAEDPATSAAAALDALGDSREAAAELREAELRGTLRQGGGAAADRELMRLRSARVTAAGEAAVRAAYARLLNAKHQPLWDLWRKRHSVTAALLGGASLEGVREALLQVRGFSGPDTDAEAEGWGLAFDLMTTTPLTDNMGPVAWSGDYAAWLRRRVAKNKAPSAAASVSRTGPISARRRPVVPVLMDSTGYCC